MAGDGDFIIKQHNVQISSGEAKSNNKGAVINKKDVSRLVYTYKFANIFLCQQITNELDVDARANIDDNSRHARHCFSEMDFTGSSHLRTKWHTKGRLLHLR